MRGKFYGPAHDSLIEQIETQSCSMWGFQDVLSFDSDLVNRWGHGTVVWDQFLYQMQPLRGPQPARAMGP